MSDINLRINGDSSSAQAAFRDAGGAVEDLGDDVGKSVVKWQELVNVAKAVTAAVVKFGVDAVKAYAESERVQKQLTRAAGEYADVLGEQADALSRKYAVDDDIIKQSQVLLTQWGGVGAATEDVTKAILNYAAATGQDAVAATSDLIRNVESGGVGLAKMGVHFTSTGQKGKDLAAAVAALNNKFGGAAAADASSLTGSIHAASLAFEDLQKDLGESIAGFLQETGAVGALTQAMRNLQEFMGQKQANKLFEDGFRMGEWVNAQKKLADMQSELAAAKRDGAAPSIIALFEEDVRNAQAAVDKLKGSAAAVVLPGVTGLTNKGVKDLAATQPGRTDEERLADAKKFYTDLDAIEAHAAEQEAALLKDRAKQHDAFLASLQKQSEETWAEVGKSEEAALEAAKKSDEVMARWRRETAESNAKAEGEWNSMGDRIGAAFVEGLSTQLQNLTQGGEFDVAIFVGDILASVVSIAGSVIGTAYGQPALGAAIGNLAGMGLRAGASAISAGRKPKKYHSGGWVGDEISHLPRYHSGAWIGGDEQLAILQKDERVASNQEVRNAGGPAALDATLAGKAARPAVVVNVHALDSKSAADSFISDVGDGLRDALRSGQGALPALLMGANPR